MKTRTQTAGFSLSVALLLCSGAALSQSADKDPAAVLELGGAAGWSIPDGGSSFGPTAAIEITPVENWLELEAGVTPLFAAHSREVDVDLLFKKPWELSRKLEFMAGLGPEWIHASQSGAKTNSLAGEAALDFMYWPYRKHRYGWYVEPGFECDFGHGHEKSLGISGGLLIAIP